MKSNSNKKIKFITLTGLFIALTYVFTALVHIPTTKGYVHIGDGIIFLASSILPKPYPVAAACIGGGLSDALSGYIIWLPATAIIKALTSLCFTSKKGKIICKRNLFAIIPSLAICVGGYGLYSGMVIYNSLVTGFADAFANTMQVILSGILYVVSGTALDKMNSHKV